MPVSAYPKVSHGGRCTRTTTQANVSLNVLWHLRSNVRWHLPRLVNVGLRHVGQLWDPLADVLALKIVVLRLHDRQMLGSMVCT